MGAGAGRFSDAILVAREHYEAKRCAVSASMSWAGARPSRTAQPSAGMADSLSMNPANAGEAEADKVYAILWIGALLVAADEIADPFPDEVILVAATYFRRFPPRAKA